MQSETSGAAPHRPTGMDELGGVPRPETRETTTARPAFQQRPTTPRTALPEAITKRPDIAEFLGAFAVGAILGASAALLLRPEPLRGTARIRRDLAPYRKRVRQNALLARRNFAASTDAAAAAAEALGQAGRTLVRDLRTEVAEIVGNARLDLSDAVNEQVGQALKTLRRGSRFKGRH